MGEDEPGMIRKLAQFEDAIVARWADIILQVHPGSLGGASGTDRFRNPADFLVKDSLHLLFDAVLHGPGPAPMAKPVEDIVRVLAVRGDGTDPVLLGSVLRRLIDQYLASCESADPVCIAGLGRRIDELESMASEALRRCRERISDIRMREAQRRNWVSARIALKRHAGVSP